ncbi:MAG: diaminopimelate decarboxylase [Alphaproteobacteria bacterium]|nr:diaminopimelate decarboxylase [Alphaproteobacteria bacterium]
MHHFEYRDGTLHAEEVNLAALAERVGTPFYCYSSAALRQHYQAFATAMPKGSLIAYSVKANGNLAILRELARLGCGADIVSGGELRKALAAGIAPARIVYSGVGKTVHEMERALKAGILQFNVESEAELEALNSVALALNTRAPVAIRVNPDVDARTHAKITTGTAQSKFGISWNRAEAIYARAASLSGIRIVGIDCHIGSQIVELAPFEAAFTRLIALARQLRSQGHPITTIDFGGGLGVAYRSDNAPPPEPRAYGTMVASLTRALEAQLIFEPGRRIVAEAGVLVARVIYVKETESKRFVILDAGMNDLLRPALYDAYHEIVPLNGPKANTTVYDVVGPVCETADLFAQERALPELKAGDLVAILTAGAYGAVMSSAYNARAPAAEVLVDTKDWAIIRGRADEEALVEQDRLPPWLED